MKKKNILIADLTLSILLLNLIIGFAHAQPSPIGSPDYASVKLSGIVAPASTTTYKVSCASSVTTTNMRAAAGTNAAGNTASGIHAIKIG